MTAAEKPTADEVRAALAQLDPRRQKIVAGLFASMIQNPGQVHDREWVARQLAEMVVLAGEFEADTPDAGVRAVHAFLEENGAELLTASLLLFQRVGLDLAPRAEQGFELEEAVRIGLGYLPS